MTMMRVLAVFVLAICAVPAAAQNASPSGTPPPCTATVVVTVTPSGGGEAEPVPALNAWTMWLLALVLASVGAGFGRRTRGR